MSFDLVRRRGPWIYDPRELPAYSIPMTNLVRSTVGGLIVSDVAVFFTGSVQAIDREPGSAYITRAWNTWVSDTYYTVGTDTGAGLVSNFISPTVDGAGAVTWRITVDGVAYVVVTAAAALSRTVLGYVFPTDAYHAATNYGLASAAISTDGSTMRLDAANVVLMGASDPRQRALLRYERSLTVEVKIVPGCDSVAPGSTYAAYVNRGTN